MPNVKHIHEVIFLIEQHNAQWTPDELTRAIAETWGEDVCFGSCSGTAFPKEDALEFLVDRQKAVLSGDGRVTLHPSMKICNGHQDFSAG